MHITEIHQQLEAATRQHDEAIAQSAALTGQIKAAVRREADLKQQLNASQAEQAKLGFMQLGKRMLVKAEQDNLRKKLTANHQLQESLLAKQQTCHAQQVALESRIAQLRAALADAQAAVAQPAVSEAPAAVQPAVEPIVPAVCEEVPAAVPPAVPADAAPAVPAPDRKPREARPKAHAAPHAPRTPKLDASLPAQEQFNLLLPRLEAFYPERQVFSLDSICSDLNTKLNAIAPRCGCANLAELLQQNGFKLITGMQGRELRKGKYCTPGQEPEIIRPLISSVQRRLEKHYPDRRITRSIQHDHKSLAQDVTGLYLWLGYANAKDMLTAYGFQYQVTTGGRPATDAQTLLDTLRAAYPDGEKPRTIAQLMADHPELAHSLKTLQNQSPARYGMPLKQYLAEQGILAARRADNA